jgi:acetyltransferase-like isoleucine patch superfamily enzyme
MNGLTAEQMGSASLRSGRPKKFLFLPTWLRNCLKSVGRRLTYRCNRFRFVRRGRFVYVGSGLRLSCNRQHKVVIGDNSNVEEYNIWEARTGDIIMGQDCWLGLHNLLMGPVRMGDGVRTGPFVSVLGPKHARLNGQEQLAGSTTIGHNVWISTGAIVHFGVTIGDGAVVGPGAVVTKDVAVGAYVAGNPARDITRMSGLPPP